MHRAVGLICASLFLVCAPCRVLGGDRPPSGATRADLPILVINDAAARQWVADDLVPPPRCDDFEFLRRATLDIIGRIATKEELDRYLQDPAKTRRGLLVERLLAHPDYARHWARRWARWLIEPTAVQTAPANQDRERALARWLEGQFRQEKMSYRTMVRELLTATGTPGENSAVPFTLAHVARGGKTLPACCCVPEPQILADFGDVTELSTSSLTIKTGELFLGFSAIGCCQCHDHPFDAALKQRDFWALDSCFQQLTVGPGGRLRDDLKANSVGVQFYEKRDGTIRATGPRLVEGDHRHPIIARGKVPRRQQLAECIVNHQNFAPALIDRMWGQFFACKLTAGDPLSEVVGPEAECEDGRPLGWLGRHFCEDDRDDPRNLIRWFCASDDYNRKAAHSDDARPYLATLRQLEVGQVVDSLLIAVRPTPEALPPGGLEALRQRWVDLLGPHFEDSGYEGTAPRLSIAWTLMNDEHIHAYLEPSKSETLREAVRLNRKSAHAAIDHLFQAAWNRPCPPEECRQLLVAGGLPENTLRLPEADADAFLQDVLWSLVNSGGFALRH